MNIVFASNNTHKIDEVKKIIPSTYNLLSLKDINCNEEIPENMPTLEGNSYEKAMYVFNKYHLNCFADDTGLEVDALGGEPGVFSARYAGLPSNPQKNIEKVLEKLMKYENKNARFRTIVTLIIDSNIFQFEGIVEGKIINEQKGTSGFGYDPIFIPNGYDKTFAELPLFEKNKISHRGIATQKLMEFLSNY